RRDPGCSRFLADRLPRDGPSGIQHRPTPITRDIAAAERPGGNAARTVHRRRPRSAARRLDFDGTTMATRRHRRRPPRLPRGRPRLRQHGNTVARPGARPNDLLDHLRPRRARSPMSASVENDNIAIVRRFIDGAVNGGNLDIIAEAWAEDMTWKGEASEPSQA